MYKFNIMITFGKDGWESQKKLFLLMYTRDASEQLGRDIVQNLSQQLGLTKQIATILVPEKIFIDILP